MVIYEIENMKFWYFLKLTHFGNSMIFVIVKFGKFLESARLEIFRIFQISNFRNFLIWQFLEFS